MDNVFLEDLWNEKTGIKFIKKGNCEIFVNINSKNKKFIRGTCSKKTKTFDFSNYGLKLCKEWIKRNGEVDG